MKQSGSHNTHARLAPSGAKTWVNCTASVAHREANAHRIPKERDSEWSRLGTEAHDWATKVLEKEITIEEVPEEFRDAVRSYVEFCLGLIPEGASYLVEQKTPLFFQPDHHGTLDFGYVSDDLVVISDLKYGAGVLVECEGNLQLSIYALSLVRLFEGIYNFTPDTKVVLAIHQPRHRDAADQAPWEITLTELEAMGKDIEYRAIQAHAGLERVREKLPCGERDISPDEILEAAPGLEFKPQGGDGGSCRWCDCRGFCSARLAACDDGMPEGSTVDFLSLLPDLDKEERKAEPSERLNTYGELMGLGHLSDENLVGLYKSRKTIETFLKDVAEYLETLALEGRPAPGSKLVLGCSGNRAWSDPAAADTFLTGQKLHADDRYKKKLISPTEAEKLLKDKLTKTRTANRFESLVTRSAPKKVLALADDKRPAVGATVDMLPDLTAADDFEV